MRIGVVERVCPHTDGHGVSGKGTAVELDCAVWIKHKCGFQGLSSHPELAAKILPSGYEAVLFADRGFGDRQLFKKVLALGCGFRIRLKTSMCVGHHRRNRAKIGTLMPARVQELFLHWVWLTDRWFSPVHLALAHVQTKNGFEEWPVVSIEPTSLKTIGIVDEQGRVVHWFLFYDQADI